MRRKQIESGKGGTRLIRNIDKQRKKGLWLCLNFAKKGGCWIASRVLIAQVKRNPCIFYLIKIHSILLEVFIARVGNPEKFYVLNLHLHRTCALLTHEKSVENGGIFEATCEHRYIYCTPGKIRTMAGQLLRK